MPVVPFDRDKVMIFLLCVFMTPQQNPEVGPGRYNQMRSLCTNWNFSKK